MKMKELPYTKKNRLADVMALIQVLAMYKEAHRTEEAIRNEFQRSPLSAETWIKIAEEHREFFRLREGKGKEISLIARHAQEDYNTLDSDYTTRLMETAIKLHDSQLESSRWWTFWLPVIGAFLGALLAIFFAK
ncbi:MAG: hypothetical protein PHU91_01325 [Candidatus Omnitrophica bacterium]|nr:hypothetical protein [Candidatus Omnitrophota bacterium]MDD5611278.1 hypothetical protein [Candidatus Omnitrophota bacterium]